MIAAFVAEKMSSYITGGMNPATAAKFTRGELSAIYNGDHRSRDSAGQWCVTPPTENLDIETALIKADAAIAEIISRNNPAPAEKPRNIYRSSDAIKQALAAGIGIKEFFAKSKDNDPAAYTADIQEIAVLWNQGKRRFKAFVRGRFLAIDIDRHPGKVDGLETFYKLWPPEILPAELQDLPDSFPCYVQTPNGGVHLYFKYAGPEVKLRELAPGIEIKEWQITAPGSRRENGEYILHGELTDAPPLYGFLLDHIEKVKRQKEREKAARQHTPRYAADRPIRFDKPRISLDDLTAEAAAAYGGHHDRQVSFAYRACRCKFSVAEALAYVKSRPDIFGNDADTEKTILSVFRDNGGRL